MNELCLTNNEGWSFTYTDTEEKPILVKDKFGIEYEQKSFIYLNDLKPSEKKSLKTSKEIDRTRLMNQFLRERFIRLSNDMASRDQQKTFQIQCYKYDHTLHIIFGKYGLDGGGKRKLLTFAAGTTKIAVGILAGTVATLGTGGIAAPIMTCGGTGLLFSGMGDIAYAFKTPEDEITTKGYAIQSTIGFTAGIAGGGTALVANAVAVSQGLNVVATAALSSAASSTVSTAASTATEAAIKQDPTILERLTTEKLVTNAAAGLITGGVSTLSNGLIERGGRLLFNPSSHVSVNLVIKTVVGAVAGATSSSAVKITQNLINQQTFLQVKYANKPQAHLIERDKLYVYVEDPIIYFLSIDDEKNEHRITRIKSQEDLQVGHDQDTSIEELLAILRSNGTKEFSDKQKDFILTIAAKNHHVLSVWNGVRDAVAIGASTGAVTGFVKGVTDQWQKSSSASKNNLNEKKRKFKSKRAQNEEKASDKKRARSDDEIDESEDPRIQKKQAIKDEKEEKTCVSSSEQIEAAQQARDKADQKYQNLMALSGYTDVDIENVANNIYNRAKDKHPFNQIEAIKYIEEKASEEYGIPMGTLTHSLIVAYKSKNHKDTNVPNPIIAALIERRNTGSALSLAEKNLYHAKQVLQNLKEHKCELNENEVFSPQTLLSMPSSVNILEMVTDSENEARKQGFENNIYVQMRYLAGRIAGIDHGDLYEQIYKVYFDASFKWEKHHGEDKPTEYGFLTYVTDWLINKESTVPVEVKQTRWYQDLLKSLGEKGVRFQTNGSNLHVLIGHGTHQKSKEGIV
jgi:hypothetical protein